MYPEWKVDSEFISEHLNNALDLDAKLSSHPIEVHCPDANQIKQVRPECHTKHGHLMQVIRFSTSFLMPKQALVRNKNCLVALRLTRVTLTSPAYAVELCRPGAIPQGCLDLPQEASIWEQCHEGPVGGDLRVYWEGCAEDYG